MGSLNFIATSILSTGTTVLRRLLLAPPAMGTDQFYATLLKTLTQWIAVRSTIIDQMLRDMIRNLQSIQCRLDQLPFAVIGTSEVDCQWRSLGIDDIKNLGSLTAFGVSDSVTPFFARANQASAAASFQSIRPSLFNSSSSSNHSPSKIPIRVHSSNRRQQVLGEGKHFGNFSHWQPVISTYKIPSRQSRERWAGRPPRGCSSGSGIKGEIRSH
jgi:hypothetical protein